MKKGIYLLPNAITLCGIVLARLLGQRDCVFQFLNGLVELSLP